MAWPELRIVYAVSLCVALVTCLPTRAVAMTFSVSIYTDWSPSSDNANLEVVVDTSDDSSDLGGCGHYNYQVFGYVTGPYGSDGGNYQAGLSRNLSVTISDDEASYSISGGIAFTCSCAGDLAFGSGPIDLGLARRVSYYKYESGDGFPDNCWYGNGTMAGTDCTSGAPTCLGPAIALPLFTCPPYGKATYVVYAPGTPSQECLYPGFGSGTYTNVRPCS